MIVDINTNMVYICNMIFYLCPYVAMLLHDLSDKFIDKIKTLLNLITTILLGTATLFSTYKLLTLGYVTNGQWAEIFGFIPPYLALFYCLGAILTVYLFYSRGYTYYRSTYLGFILTYISSFYWELPENIYWQLKRGYHPTILFVLLAAFPYIWLNKNLGWVKNKQNVILVLLGLATTTYGVLTMPSGIYITYSGVLYFLFCRAVCLLVLIKIFIFNHEAGKNERQLV